jgi:threonine/homoserine/homoserine lactone efflux protein
MESLYQLLALLGAGLIVWVAYRTIKGRPELFSREKLGKSSTSLGILAIVLIMFVALLILMVRQG